MMKNIRILLSISILCMTFTMNSFASAKNIEIPIERNDSAQIYEGQVRINTLTFNNTEVKEPILLYQGSYYLPMTPMILNNLGITSSISDGLLTYGLDVPSVSGEKQKPQSIVNEVNRVSVLVYQKNTDVNNIVINPANSYLPVIVYSNTFYVPLNDAIINNGLEIELYFDQDNVLTIHRSIDKMPRGTIITYPNNIKKEYLSNVESSLLALKDSIVSDGLRYEENGQIEYHLTVDSKEMVYVSFNNGDWLISSVNSDRIGHIYYYYANDQYHYVGEYDNGEFKGIGRLIDEKGNVTAIKDFEREPVVVPFSQRGIKFEHYTPVLGLLIEFEDESIIGTEDIWYHKLFGNDSNSLSGYYKEITNGNLQIIPAIEQNNVLNDGIIKIKLDMPHPNTGTEIENTESIFALAIEELKNQIDITLYDKNDNGVIDREELVIIAILAGYEASKETPIDYPQLRSHHIFSDISFGVVDGVGILNMIYISELEYFSGVTELSTNAVLAHEFGHQMGLPDLYDIDGTSKGLGPFSLMAEGTNNYASGDRPGEVIANLDPWSYIQLNSASPLIISESGEYTLNSMETGQYNIIRVNTSKPSEYFLLENRTIKGRDLSLKTAVKQNGGILIYHIDEEIIDAYYNFNSINADERKKGVDIEESSERSTGSALDNNNYKDRFAPFFSAKGIKLFDNNSKPLSRLNDGTDSGVTVEVLSDGPSSTVKITIE